MPADEMKINKGYPGAWRAALLRTLIYLGAAATTIVFASLVGYILIRGIPNLRPSLFAREYTSENVSMLPAIINTAIVMLATLLLAVPIGLFSAVYLSEYAKKTSRFVGIIRLATETLSGVPSIVYGLFGYLVFVVNLRCGYSLIAAAVTLAIMVLPTIIRTGEEAILAVPISLREASRALGAGKLRTIFRVVLPSAGGGIVAGIILAVGRIAGETAALLFTGGTGTTVATGLFDSSRTLSVHMYALLTERLHMEEAYATAVVLLLMITAINALSSFVAKRLGARSNNG